MQMPPRCPKCWKNMVGWPPKRADLVKFTVHAKLFHKRVFWGRPPTLAEISTRRNLPLMAGQDDTAAVDHAAPIIRAEAIEAAAGLVAFAQWFADQGNEAAITVITRWNKWVNQ